MFCVRVRKRERKFPRTPGGEEGEVGISTEIPLVIRASRKRGTRLMKGIKGRLGSSENSESFHPQTCSD